jgi:hypothetical protein
MSTAKTIGSIVAGILIAFFIIVVIGVIISVAVVSSIDVEEVKPLKLTRYDGDEPGSFCRDYPIDVQCM